MKRVDFLRKILTDLAFNEPWFYLMLLCVVVMMIIVQFGNPLLPFPSLSKYGWAWHHIPEIFMFFFFGIWYGEWKIFHSRRNHDVTTIILVIAIFFAWTLVKGLLIASVLIGIIFAPPFFVGYLCARIRYGFVITLPFVDLTKQIIIRETIFKACMQIRNVI